MKTCNVVRALCHTQVLKVPGIKRKKAHLIEIQINGGSTTDKINFCKEFLEQNAHLYDVFQSHEMIDVVSITKGKGNKGVVSRYGVTNLPRKTHRGLRKVACVGAWHPSAVKWTVSRAGQMGFHRRTEINKEIFKTGKNLCSEKNKVSTIYDLTDKGI